MASPSEHKEGLRCGRKEQGYPPWGTVDECLGLILERDPEHGLGVRCIKKSRTEAGVWRDKKEKCGSFHPLEVLLSQAVEQNLLNPKQREAIRKVVSEKSERQKEEEIMVDVRKKSEDPEKIKKLVRAFIATIEARSEFVEEETQNQELASQILFANNFAAFLDLVLAKG
ncbi:MAG: hypothetical protein WAP23_03905, partial [Candidatus Spechtbacterales bacterium]